MLVFAGGRVYLMVDGAVHMHGDSFEASIRSYHAQLDAAHGFIPRAPRSAAEGAA